jgi:hypothetical protein
MPTIKKTKKLGRTREQQQIAVLNAYEQYANVTRACKAVKVPRRTFYAWMKDKAFEVQFEASSKVALGVLEDEATRRAVEGTIKPILYKGKIVAKVREYSDVLTIVLLKARAPEKYKDRIANEHSGEMNITWKEEKTYEAEPKADDSH